MSPLDTLTLAQWKWLQTFVPGVWEKKGMLLSVSRQRGTVPHVAVILFSREPLPWVV